MKVVIGTIPLERAADGMGRIYQIVRGNVRTSILSRLVSLRTACIDGGLNKNRFVIRIVEMQLPCHDRGISLVDSWIKGIVTGPLTLKGIPAITVHDIVPYTSLTPDHVAGVGIIELPVHGGT